MSTTKAEITTLLEQEIKDLADSFETEDYSNACDQAERETGWAYPVADGFRTLWQKERAKRHLFFFLLSQSTEEFQVRTIKLNQTFEHLDKTVDRMDKAFEAIIESRPEEFANVDAMNMFGTKFDAGFQYDDLGRDTTYDDTNLTILKPNESS